MVLFEILLYVTTQVSTGDGLVLVPPLTIALNQTECMCESMESLAAGVGTPSGITATCQSTLACDGVTCAIEALGMTLTVEIDFRVCDEPPGSRVMVLDSSNDVIFDKYFNSSDMDIISLGLFTSLNLDVFIEHHDYSMILQVGVTVIGYTMEVFYSVYTFRTSVNGLLCRGALNSEVK